MACGRPLCGSAPYRRRKSSAAQKLDACVGAHMVTSPHRNNALSRPYCRCCMPSTPLRCASTIAAAPSEAHAQHGVLLACQQPPPHLRAAGVRDAPMRCKQKCVEHICRANFGAYDEQKVRAGRAEPACAKCRDNVELNRTTRSGVTLAINEREGGVAGVHTAATVVHPRSEVHNSCCNAHSRRDATRSRCSRVLAQSVLPCPRSIGDPGGPPAS